MPVRISSGWHRIKGLGKWTNMTSRYGDGYRLILTYELSRKIANSDVERQAMKNMVEHHFAHMLYGKPQVWVDVWAADRARTAVGPVYVAGNKTAYEAWNKERARVRKTRLRA